jgi:hypothetical protein
MLIMESYQPILRLNRNLLVEFQLVMCQCRDGQMGESGYKLSAFYAILFITHASMRINISKNVSR